MGPPPRSPDIGDLEDLLADDVAQSDPRSAERILNRQDLVHSSETIIVKTETTEKQTA